MSLDRNNDTIDNNKFYKTIYYYAEDENQTGYYEIRKLIDSNRCQKKYRTSISLKNSRYQFVSYFDELIEAQDFVDMHEELRMKESL